MIKSYDIKQAIEYGIDNYFDKATVIPEILDNNPYNARVTDILFEEIVEITATDVIRNNDTWRIIGLLKEDNSEIIIKFLKMNTKDRERVLTEFEKVINNAGNE